MSHSRFQKLLHDNEVIESVIRQYGVTVLPKITVAFFLCALPFFFIFPFLRLGFVGAILLILLLVFALLYTLRLYVVWFFHVLLITNKRIIDIHQKGLFNKTVSEAELTEIQDIQYTQKGVFATLFQYGTMTIKVAGSDLLFEMKHVKQPLQVQRFLLDLRQQIRGNALKISSDTL